MKVTAEQVKQAAYRKGITGWTADRCPSCDYPIRFQFYSDGSVKHDAGCNYSDHETARPIKYLPSSWEDVAACINNTRDEQQIEAIKKFWSI